MIATAITALLTSVSAENTNIRLNEIKPTVDGKIIVPKNIAGKINSNKKIGQKDDDKWNLICGLTCDDLDKANAKKVGKKSAFNKAPRLDKKPNLGKAPIFDAGKRP